MWETSGTHSDVNGLARNARASRLGEREIKRKECDHSAATVTKRSCPRVRQSAEMAQGGEVKRRRPGVE